MRLPTRIYLTGFMGSGKSTLGPMVANVLGYDFLDMDAVLEERFGCTIADFFVREGEPAFRAAEADLLAETTVMEEVVISAGGGALTRKQNMETARAGGLVVYLRFSSDDLAGRLSRSRDRPMLHDDEGSLLSHERLQRRIADLLADREPFYMQADVIVELREQAVGTSVDAVVAAIRKWRRRSSLRTVRARFGRTT